MHLKFLSTAAFVLNFSAGLFAASLDEATITNVVAEVAISSPRQKAQPGAERQIIRADERLHVGPRSRAELTFPDATVARLGADSLLGFRRGTRELALDRGTLLLDVPSFRGGARVVLGGLSAHCGAATVLIEHLPPKSLKVMVLAGEVRVAVRGFLGDSIVIPPGKMLITTPDAKRLPDPVDVDLRTLAETSSLIAGAAPLRGLPRVQREIARQAAAVKKKRLIPTNLAIVGSGTNVVLPGTSASQPTAPVPAAAPVSVPAPVEPALPEPGGNPENANPIPAEYALRLEGFPLDRPILTLDAP